MKLSRGVEHRHTVFHGILKKMDIHELAKNRIFTCNECKGTGLKGLYLTKYGKPIGWDCQSYCEKCEGIGFVGNFKTRKITDQIFLCAKCYGDGCSQCNHKGIVDWVAHVMGR